MHPLTDKPNDLNKLLDANKDTFAEDETYIGTIPLAQISIDAGTTHK